MTAAKGDTQRRRFPAGHILIRQGQPGDRAWLIESGELEVAIATETGGLRKVGEAGPGSLVGEMALIDNGPRSASVRTRTDVVAVELSKAVFDRMIEMSEPLTRYLLESLIATVRRAYGLMPEERREGGGSIRSIRTPLRMLDRRVFPEYHVIFREGDTAHHAFLIQSGRVDIGRGETLLAELGPGRIFGAMALIGNRPRAADAVVVEPATCEIIQREDFDAALASMPPILKTLARTYVERIATSHQD